MCMINHGRRDLQIYRNKSAVSDPRAVVRPFRPSQRQGNPADSRTGPEQALLPTAAHLLPSAHMPPLKMR